MVVIDIGGVIIGIAIITLALALVTGVFKTGRNNQHQLSETQRAWKAAGIGEDALHFVINNPNTTPEVRATVELALARLTHLTETKEN